jgi:hypothetical protein
MRRNEIWEFKIKSIKAYITYIDDSIKETLYYQEKEKQKKKDRENFVKEYCYDLNKERLEKFRNECGNKFMEEYCNKQLNIKDKKKQNISPISLIDEIYKYEPSEDILHFYIQSFMSVKTILIILFKNFLDKAPIFPYSIRCVCKMIKILIKKKFPDISLLDTYYFVAKYFFSIIFFPFLKAYDNEVYIDLIVDDEISSKIKFFINF